MFKWINFIRLEQLDSQKILGTRKCDPGTPSLSEN